MVRVIITRDFVYETGEGEWLVRVLGLLVEGSGLSGNRSGIGMMCAQKYN